MYQIQTSTRILYRNWFIENENNAEFSFKQGWATLNVVKIY